MLPKPNLTELLPQGAPPLPISKSQLQLLIEVITGHDLLGKHLVHWKEDQVPTCRLCKKAGETYYHLVFECESLIVNEIWELFFIFLSENFYIICKVKSNHLSLCSINH